MSGSSNLNPIKNTFLLGSRFSTDKSLAILLDSVRSQEYYEIADSIFRKETYDYDTFIFSADNNAPVLVAPCGLFYYNYLEQYNGSVLALTLRGAINAAESGSHFISKIWHISDISEFKMAEITIPKLFAFFDSIYFVNETVRTIFFTLFPSLDKGKTKLAPIDIMKLEANIK